MSLHGARVLLADDDPTTRFVMAEFVRRGGGFPTTTEDGEQALARLAAEEFDVVITDLSMPGASGLVVAERARARLPHAGVVILTGYADPGLDADVTALGVILLRKPARPAALLDAVTRALAAAAE